MTDVWRAPFRDLCDALGQLAKARTAHDRLRALQRVRKSALDIASKRESVAHVVQLLESLPAKSRTTQHDLDALKKLQAKLDAMTREKEASDKLVASLKAELTNERAAHEATKATHHEQLAEVNKHILAIKAQMVHMDKQIAEAMAVLGKRSPKLFRLLTDPAKEALEQKLVKLERFMAALRTKMSATVSLLSSSEFFDMQSTIVPPQVTMTKQRLLQTNGSISGKTYGPAKAEADRFVALIQKHILVGDEGVRWLASNPLFEMSLYAKYLRATARTNNTAEVLSHVHYFSALALAGAAATQMRVFHLAATQLLLKRDAEMQSKIADNFAAARELNALVRDTLTSLSAKHTHQFYFEHEVQAENQMLAFLKRQSQLFEAAQASIVRYIATLPDLAAMANALAAEFLSDDQIYVNAGISPNDLQHATQLTLQDLEPLQACVDIIKGYREMRVSAAKHLWASSTWDAIPVKSQNTNIQLAKRMLDEIKRHRPQWAQCRAGVQLLMASVTLDVFASTPEPTPLHIIDFRDTVNYQVAELLASAESAEQIAGLLDAHVGTLGPLQLDEYVRDIEASPPAPSQSLWRYGRKELRSVALNFEAQGHAIKHFLPDWLLLCNLRENELTGAQGYVKAITDHTMATEALAGTDILNVIVQSCIMLAPDVGTPPNGVQLTHIAQHGTPMAQAAALTAALLQDRKLELPAVDMDAARRVVQHIAQLNPASLVRVLQQTPSVQTIVDELGGHAAISSDTIDEFLRRHPTVLRLPPEKSMVWFRSNECLAEGNCGDPGALVSHSLFECLSALETLVALLDVVAHGATKIALAEHLTKQAKRAVRFANVEWVLDGTRQFHDTVQAPTGDSLRLQLIQSQKRNREQLVVQQHETAQLRKHIGQLYELHAAVSKRMQETITVADEQRRKADTTRAALQTSVRATDASFFQLKNLKMQLAAQGERLVSHELMATIMQQKYAAALQTLEITTDPDQRRALQTTVDSLKAAVQTAQSQPTSEQTQLKALKDYFEQQIAVMQAQATVLVNDASVADTSAAAATNHLSAVQCTMDQCSQQLSLAERELLDRLNTRMMLASQAALAVNDEERAHLLHQLRTMRDSTGAPGQQNTARAARLHDLQQSLAELVTTGASARAQLKQQLEEQAKQFDIKQFEFKQKLQESNAHLAEVRAKLADMGARSQLSGNADAQFKIGSDMLRQIGAALKQELDVLKPWTDALSINTSELLARVHTVVNANIASPSDLQLRSIDLSEALRMFVQLHAAKMQDINAKLKEYDEQSRKRAADLEREIQALKQQISDADIVAHKYSAVQQYLQQQVADETSLTDELEKQFAALVSEGKQALGALANLRMANVARPADIKQQLSSTIVAYQARYNAVLATVVDTTRARLNKATQVYEASLPSGVKWSGDMKTLPVQNAEGMLMLSLHAAWRRAQVHKDAALLDLEAFVQFILTTLDRVVASDIQTQTYRLEQLAAAAMAYKVSDVDALQRELDNIVVAINKTDDARAQWQEVEQLQQVADELASRLNSDTATHELEKQTRVAYVSVAARAAAAGGAVAQAYTLMSRIAELRFRDVQQQQLSTQIDQLTKAKRESEAELHKIRNVQQEREIEYRAAIARLKAEQQEAINVNAEVAGQLQRQLDASSRTLRDSEAAHLFVQAKTAVVALQALREMHMSQTPEQLFDQHTLYVSKANVSDVSQVVLKAKTAVTNSLLPNKVLMNTSLDAMAAWLEQVRKQDTAIADFIGATDKTSNESDYLDKLKAMKQADTVHKLELQSIPDVDANAADGRVVRMLADQLDHVRADIQARELSLGAMRQFIATMTLQQEALSDDNKKLGTELAELKTAADKKIAGLEKAKAVAESKHEQTLNEVRDIKIKLQAMTNDPSEQDLRVLLARLNSELATLQTMRSTYQSLVDQNTLLRKTLDTLDAQKTTIDEPERRVEVAKQLVEAETALTTAQQQAAASKEKSTSNFAAQRAELAGRDAVSIEKYREHLTDWLKQEMQTIDQDIAQQERDEGLGPEARDRKRSELFNNLALEAEERLEAYANTLQKQTDHEIQQLTLQHEDQLRALEDNLTKEVSDAKLMVETLQQVAHTLDMQAATEADTSDRYATIVKAVAALKHRVEQDAQTIAQHMTTTQDLQTQLSEAQQQLADTTQQLRELQQATKINESSTVHRLYQQLTLLKQQFAATEERAVLLEADNSRLSNELQRAEQQAEVLRRQLKDMNMQWQHSNDELVITLREVTEERDALKRQLESLSANSSPEERTGEDIVNALSQSVEFQQILDTINTLQDSNAQLEQQLQQAKDDRDQAEMCDLETARFMRKFFPTLAEGTDLLKLPVDTHNLCWLAKQLAFYENTGMFDSYWKSFNNQPQRVRLALWKGLRELFIQKHIIKAEGQSPDACNLFTTPMSCMQNSNRCFFDNDTCVQL